MVISCSTCQKEDHLWSWMKYVMYAVSLQFKFWHNLHTFFLPNYNSQIWEFTKILFFVLQVCCNEWPLVMFYLIFCSIHENVLYAPYIVASCSNILCAHLLTQTNISIFFFNFFFVFLFTYFCKRGLFHFISHINVFSQSLLAECLVFYKKSPQPPENLTTSTIVTKNLR